jgi:hypothetical protein
MCSALAKRRHCSSEDFFLDVEAGRWKTQPHPCKSAHYTSQIHERQECIHAFVFVAKPEHPGKLTFFIPVKCKLAS